MLINEVLLSAILISTSHFVEAVAIAGLLGSTGCGKSHKADGRTRSFTINSTCCPNVTPTRNFNIHLPTIYNLTNPTALIVSYHGAGETPDYHEKESQLSNGSYNSDMIVVYPEGVKKVWQGPTYADPAVSDKIFTTELLRYLRGEYCIDDTRIYANGKSNGGGFVGSLACSAGHGADFAAFSAVVGAFYNQAVPGSVCRPASSPLPILEFHGTDDGRANYDGNDTARGGPLPPIQYWLTQWAIRDGCPNPPTNVTKDSHDGKVHYGTYSCNGVQDVVQHYRIDGMGHVWPRVSKGNQIDATPLIVDFFKSNRKHQSEEVLISIERDIHVRQGIMTE